MDSINQFLKQGMPAGEPPLNLHLPTIKPTAISSMSCAELGANLMKGMQSLQSDKTYTTDEVDWNIV